MNPSPTFTAGSVTDATAQPSGQASGMAAQMSDRAHQMVDRAAEKAVPALERASGAAHRTIDKVAGAATPAADWAAENARQLEVKSHELVDACSAYVRARPLACVAGALALGYFAGRVMR
jgi:ElaB/YqjD/DUF883 family membrane-anchored ribosome-binding protein